MKFIHLTDTHVIGSGDLYGKDPAARLRAAVQSINAEHGDAAFVVLTGDMTHWGDPAAYARFSPEICDL
ncbi:metallophosphoesterase [Roseovarius carneus]|uniref:metallophosphoesterase n=1 Tax=Roseovarius carneus TaxID=2853164 RepID=UPI001CCBF803|nr:metallophosphoesterase [Roseovarius carneus]